MNQGAGIECEATVSARLRALVQSLLGLDDAEAAALDAGSRLFGAHPAFDSMAVAGLLAAIEEDYGVLIDDSEVSAEDFATFGTLTAFVTRLTRA